MTDVVDELSREDTTLTREEVARRVEDWRARVDALYADIERWSPRGAMFDRSDTVAMDEKLMRRHSVEPVALPVLKVTEPGDDPFVVVPRGLWIIGANGRLDVFSPRSHAIIVDRAENFERPRWEIAAADDRRAGMPLTPETFAQAVRHERTLGH